MKRLQTRLAGAAAAAGVLVSALAVATSAPAAGLGAGSGGGDGGCVELQATNGSFWRVVNRCAYTVIGSFCYEGGQSLSCSGHQSGGFGPIRPGGAEGVSAPPPGAGWRASWCDYDLWVKQACRISKPWEG